MSATFVDGAFLDERVLSDWVESKPRDLGNDRGYRVANGRDRVGANAIWILLTASGNARRPGAKQAENSNQYRRCGGLALRSNGGFTASTMETVSRVEPLT